MYTARTDTPDQTPALSILFGYGPVLVILSCGIAALQRVPFALQGGALWSAAILMFLGGVVRGLSFFTEGGPRKSQMLVMLFRFGCGFAAVVLPEPWTVVPLIAGYLSVFFYDPFAARSGAAPRFFASLRRPQMAVALLGLGFLCLAGARQTLG